MKIIQRIIQQPWLQKTWNGLVHAISFGSAHLMAAGIVMWFIKTMSESTQDKVLVNAQERLDGLSSLAPGSLIFWCLMFLVVMCQYLKFPIEPIKHYTRTKKWLRSFQLFPAWYDQMRSRPLTLHNMERCGTGPIPKEVRAQVCQQLLERHPSLQNISPKKRSFWGFEYQITYRIELLISHVAHSRWATAMIMFSGLVTAAVAGSANDALIVVSIYAMVKLLCRYTVPTIENLSFTVRDLDDALSMAHFDVDVAKQLLQQMQSDRPDPVALQRIKHSDALQEYRLLMEAGNHAETVNVEASEHVEVQPAANGSQLWSNDPSLVQVETKHDRSV